MPDQEQVQEPEATSGEEEYVPGEDAGTEEPYSAQLLRQIHDDAGRLMERYDGMLPPLEHDAIRKFVEGYCEFLDSQMTAIEGHMGEHHPDLPPLDGMEPAASEDEEAGEATPDEAAEAMEPEEEEEEEEEPEGGEKSLTPEQVKDLRRRHKALPTPPQVGESALAGDEDAVEFIDDAEEQAGVNFEPHEMDSLTEAHGFLNGVVNQQDPWGSIHRHEAYYHCRSLGKIATLGDPEHIPGDEEFEQMDADGMDHEEKKYAHETSDQRRVRIASDENKIRAGLSRMGRTGFTPAGPRGGSHDVQSHGASEQRASGRTESGPSGRIEDVRARSPQESVGPRTKPTKKDPEGRVKRPTNADSASRDAETRAAVGKLARGRNRNPTKDMDGDTEGVEQNDLGGNRMEELTETKGGHRRKVGNTTAFLELLSTLQDGGLGDEHRQGAHEHASTLEDAMNGGNGEAAQEGEETTDEAPPNGDIDGETKSLLDEANEQRALILEFNKKVVELAKKLG